jgi:hypothetical protein
MHTASQRPDLWERGIDSGEVWPEYNTHGDVLDRWWAFLDVEFAELQFVLYDEDADEVLAVGHCRPFEWDGTDEALPDGFDGAIELIFRQASAGKPVNTLCALAAEIPRGNRNRGLAAQIMAGMRTIAKRHGLKHLVAPVRPSWKERYPLTPIERYVTWRREDGLLLDPWMRVHERLGARVAAPLPQSLRITGTVAEWESWTGLAFPESGDYIFPAGLAPVHIDCAANLGSYWEPNVWMVHPALH